MRKLFTLFSLLLVTSILFAQKLQHGYVRTVEKPGHPAQYLAGAHIKTAENANQAVSLDNGYFQIPVKTIGNKSVYTLTNISLPGYNLVDLGKLNKRQQYSPASIEILMISKREEEQQSKQLEAKIKADLDKYYKCLIEQLQDQLEEKKKVEQEYQRLLDRLPKLVMNLVRLDYKYLTDSLDIKIAEAYEDGNFLLACQLIDQKPSFKERREIYQSMVDNHVKNLEVVEKEAENIEKFKESNIRDCETKISYYQLRFLDDSALCYIDTLLIFEPNNGKYLLSKAQILQTRREKIQLSDFQSDLVILLHGDPDSALHYYKLALEQLRDENNPLIVDCYEGLGTIGALDVSERLGYLQRGLEIAIRDSKIKVVPKFYEKIITLSLKRKDYDSAKNCAWQCITYCDNHIDETFDYLEDMLDKLAFVYSDQDFSMMIDYFENSFLESISESISDNSTDYYQMILDMFSGNLINTGDEQSKRTYYLLMSTIYEIKNKYDSSEAYINKALSYINNALSNSFADSYPTEYLVLTLADLCCNNKEYDKSLQYLQKISDDVQSRLISEAERQIKMSEHKWDSLKESVFWGRRAFLNYIYNKMATVFMQQGLYREALQYYEIAEKNYYSQNPDVYQAETYKGIADIKTIMEEYAFALKYYDKALEIYESVLDNKAPETKKTIKDIKKCKKAMKK
jgi:tetratricopeptide (TPR) repeat protein